MVQSYNGAATADAPSNRREAGPWSVCVALPPSGNGLKPTVNNQVTPD